MHRLRRDGRIPLPTRDEGVTKKHLLVQLALCATTEPKADLGILGSLEACFHLGKHFFGDKKPIYVYDCQLVIEAIEPYSS